MILHVTVHLFIMLFCVRFTLHGMRTDLLQSLALMLVVDLPDNIIMARQSSRPTYRQMIEMGMNGRTW